jgi:hypothetical protein
MEKTHLDRFTAERWLQPDPALAVFTKLNLDEGTVSPMTSEDWFAVWQHATVDAPVPTEIINLFEQARACLAYGFFYYPLYTLGAEQLLRVAEASLAVKCAALGAPRAVRTLEKRIDWLAKNAAIPGFDGDRWHSLRKLRNATTHHAERMLLTPASVQQLLHEVASALTCVFGSPEAHTSA